MGNQITILKRDARGRVRSTAEARAEAVAEYRHSGLSASVSAKMAGISKNTFWNWLQCHGLMQHIGFFLDDATKGYREMKSYAVLGIEWKPTEIGPTYREIPIMPPKGYEHISMEIPRSDLVKKAQISNPPELAHLRYPYEQQRLAIIEATPKSAISAAPAPTTKEPTLSIPWSVLAVFILAAIGLLWLLFKNRK